MPLTGKLVSLMHGGQPLMMDTRSSGYDRLVIVADNLNATEWWGIYGDSFLVNSFLNRPLSRLDDAQVNVTLVRWLLKCAILAQWALAIAGCSLQDWNGIIITLWVVWCAASTEIFYTSQDGVRDWLCHASQVSLSTISSSFSSRRAMLSALVYLNPDTQEARLQWIDPILKEGLDRQVWQDLLLAFLTTGTYPDRAILEPHARWIEEGIAIGTKMKNSLESCAEKGTEVAVI